MAGSATTLVWTSFSLLIETFLGNADVV